ncbi:hypothetical protein RHABOEDO_001558 [Candidatus Rhabdochlamydia oedothoracis]|uniref:Uncharacterized protein n=1 Tax=Candidatus Rhabdochlamydia oedothoracis TaxID=2720720 RepID=A0ABX8V285_9BACT|nr:MULTISPECIES: hypothetical protein [Rhabdochlamydia]KAG6558960.1 hypothetical protein RHOW815_001040 [Candidatus Rhabdochlamydia sp. W815]MCL6756618.1 hypothetical protein [Candidatus Rhabdochlamydia oedothoracis]QYF49256.1 hypothetical protein RHABOEDO_001558 [Candidatus Rhabdochlamydia oedothoracis]
MSLQIQQIPFIEEANPNNLFIEKEKGYDINLLLVLAILVLVTNSKGTGALDRVVKKMEEATRITEELRGFQDNLIMLNEKIGKFQLSAEKEPTAQSWEKDQIGNIIKEFAKGVLDLQKNITELEKRVKKYPDLKTLLASTQDLFRCFNEQFNPIDSRSIIDAISDWEEDQDLNFHGTDLHFQPNAQKKDPTQFNRMIAWAMTQVYLINEGKIKDPKAENPLEDWNADDNASMQMLIGQSQQNSIEMKSYMTLITSYNNTMKASLQACKKEVQNMVREQISQN